MDESAGTLGTATGKAAAKAAEQEAGNAAGKAAGNGADEAARVLSRLERIETLDRERAPAGRLLGELRELVREAEAWARVEGDGRAQAAVAKLRGEAEGMS